MMAKRRTSLGFLTPVLLVGLAALVWSAAWLWVRGEAETRIESILAREAARGRVLECGDRTLGGYPFRLEFRCADASLTLQDGQSRTVLRLSEIRAVALVYDLDLVIVEGDGPVSSETFRLGGYRRTDRVAAGSIRASLGLDDGQVETVSAIATSVVAAIAPLAEGGDGADQAGSRVEAERAAIHVRAAPEGSRDVALDFSQLRLAGELSRIHFQSPEFEAREFSLVGRLTESGQFAQPPLRRALSQWQREGGEMLVQSLKVVAAALDVELSGTATLDADGRFEGKFRGAFGRLDRLVADLKARGVLNEDEARLAAGAVGLLARPTQGGTRAELPVRVTAGEVFLGPIKAMVLPALF